MINDAKKPWVPFSRLFLLACLLISGPAVFAYHYQWNPRLVIAYQKINDLELDAARDILREEKQSDSGNLVIPYLEDYIFFYTYYISEDVSGFERIKDQKEARLELLQKGPDDVPEYFQFQAEVLLHWAMVRGKFDAHFTAAQEVNQAFKMLKKNESRFPGHMPSMRVLYAMRAGFGSLPKKYKWIIRILSSLEGTIEEGTAGLARVRSYAGENPAFIYAQETDIISALVYLHFANEPKKGLALLRPYLERDKVSPLMRFAIANTAQASGQNETVISILEAYQPAEGADKIHHLDYMLGKAKLYRNDPDADSLLLAYVHDFKGLHFLKDAYQKLAWHALIHGNENGYNTYMHQALEVGETMFEGDKQAQVEAESGTRPHPELLKARLLFDGGYDPSALRILEGMDPEKLGFREKLEHTYRSGRVHQALGNLAEALGAYQRTIVAGKDTPFYFACNAALQSGLIHEKLGSKVRAREFFEMCLSMNPSSYESSLHQKAKMGLNRIKDM